MTSVAWRQEWPSRLASSPELPFHPDTNRHQDSAPCSTRVPPTFAMTTRKNRGTGYQSGNSRCPDLVGPTPLPGAVSLGSPCGGSATAYLVAYPPRHYPEDSPQSLCKSLCRCLAARGVSLLTHTANQAEGIRKKLQARYGNNVVVGFAMRYGNPSIPKVLDEMQAQGVRQLLVLPLYPSTLPPRRPPRSTPLHTTSPGAAGYRTSGSFPITRTILLTLKPWLSTYRPIGMNTGATKN